jgi:hypothetical protein
VVAKDAVARPYQRWPFAFDESAIRVAVAREHSIDDGTVVARCTRRRD